MSSTMVRFRGIIAAICGPRALNWRVAIWALGATSILNTLSDPYVDFKASFATSLVPFAASIPVLFIMLIADRLTRAHVHMRVFTVLGIYVLVCVARPIMIYLLLSTTDIATDHNPLLRPVGSVVTFGILVVVSFSVNVVGAFQSGITQAESTRNRLQGALELARTELDRPTSRIDDTVKFMIRDVIDGIRKDLSTTSNVRDLQAIGDAITVDATQKVRKLSREFTSQWKPVSAEIEPMRVTPHTRDLIRSSVGPDLYSPLLVTSLATFALGYGAFPRSPDFEQTAIMIVLWFTVVFVMSFCAKIAHRAIWPHRSEHSGLQAFFFLVSTAVAAEAGSLLVGPLRLGPNVTPLTQFVVLPALTLAIAMCVGLGRTLLPTSEELIAEAERTNRQIESVLARVNAQRLRTDGAIASFLHGRVQGQLIAASLLVRTHVQAGESAETVRHEVERLLDGITMADLESRELPVVDEGLKRLVEPWAHIVEFHHEISLEARRILNHDDLARFVFFDCLREGLNNSIKHGRATRVQMSAHVSDAPFANDVLVTLSDDGQKIHEGDTGGIGLISIASITTALDFESHADGSTLRVTIPFTPVAS